MSDIQGPEAYWRAELAAGRILVQRSRSSGAHIFPPRVMAPGTGIDDLAWVEIAGGGTVYSVTMISPKAPLEPYNVVLVDLDEGPRMMSRVDGVAAREVTIGMRVKARIGSKDDAPIVLFDPA
jgi:uncharacterized protein